MAGKGLELLSFVFFDIACLMTMRLPKFLVFVLYVHILLGQSWIIDTFGLQNHHFSLLHTHGRFCLLDRPFCTEN